MRKLVVCAAALALGAGAACAKGTKAQDPQTPQAGATYQGAPDDTIWEDAWDAISEGGEEVAEAGEWTLERAEDGAVIVWRGVKRVAGGAGRETDDAAIHTAIKSRLAEEDDISWQEIDVDVEKGAVTLRGRMGSRQEASKAIRIALNTRGVDQVVSYLTWPGMPQNQPARPGRR